MQHINRQRADANSPRCEGIPTWKIEAYNAERYYFSVPPVSPALWDAADWITHIGTAGFNEWRRVNGLPLLNDDGTPKSQTQ